MQLSIRASLCSVAETARLVEEDCIGGAEADVGGDGKDDEARGGTAGV